MSTLLYKLLLGDSENSIRGDTDRIARRKEHRRTMNIEKMGKRDYEQGMLCLRTKGVRTEKLLLQN